MSKSTEEESCIVGSSKETTSSSYISQKYEQSHNNSHSTTLLFIVSNDAKLAIRSIAKYNDISRSTLRRRLEEKIKKGDRSMEVLVKKKYGGGPKNQNGPIEFILDMFDHGFAVLSSERSEWSHDDDDDEEDEDDDDDDDDEDDDDDDDDDEDEEDEEEDEEEEEDDSIPAHLLQEVHLTPTRDDDIESLGMGSAKSMSTTSSSLHHLQKHYHHLHLKHQQKQRKHSRNKNSGLFWSTNSFWDKQSLSSTVWSKTEYSSTFSIESSSSSIQKENELLLFSSGITNWEMRLDTNDKFVLPLITYLLKRKWNATIRHVKKYPTEARTWVMNPQAPYHDQHNNNNNHNHYYQKQNKKQQLKQQQQQQQQQQQKQQSKNSYTRRLPIHSACAVNAPKDVIIALIRANPEGPRLRDERGMLPVHIASFVGSSTDVVLTLLHFFPISCMTKDNQGRTATDLAKLSLGENAFRIVEILERYMTLLHLVHKKERKVGSAHSIIEEVDYDGNDGDGATELYKQIEKRAWGPVILRAAFAPSEAWTWVFARPTISTATATTMRMIGSSANNHKNKRRRNRDKDGGIRRRYCWRQLPIHAACQQRAPSSVIDSLIAADPDGPMMRDDRGCLPLHIACCFGCKGSVVESLLRVYPQSCNMVDSVGSTPLEIAERGPESDNKRDILSILKLFVGVTTTILQQQQEQEQQQQQQEEELVVGSNGLSPMFKIDEDKVSETQQRQDEKLYEKTKDMRNKTLSDRMLMREDSSSSDINHFVLPTTAAATAAANTATADGNESRESRQGEEEAGAAVERSIDPNNPSDDYYLDPMKNIHSSPTFQMNNSSRRDPPPSCPYPIRVLDTNEGIETTFSIDQFLLSKSPSSSSSSTSLGAILNAPITSSSSSSSSSSSDNDDDNNNECNSIEEQMNMSEASIDSGDMAFYTNNNNAPNTPTASIDSDGSLRSIATAPPTLASSDNMATTTPMTDRSIESSQSWITLATTVATAKTTATTISSKSSQTSYDYYSTYYEPEEATNNTNNNSSRSRRWLLLPSNRPPIPMQRSSSLSSPPGTTSSFGRNFLIKRRISSLRKRNINTTTTNNNNRNKFGLPFPRKSSSLRNPTLDNNKVLIVNNDDGYIG